MPSNPPKLKWRTSAAKRLLKDLILDGTVSEETDPILLKESYNEFKPWDEGRFKTNLKNLIKSVRDGKTKKKPPKWGKSKAKLTLKDDIVSGNVTDDMDPRDVYNTCEEYQIYAFDRFKSNFETLKNAIKRDFERMEMDCIDYGHDFALLKELRKNNPIERIPWHKSNAAPLLTKDIKEGKHKVPMFKPKDLYESRPDYREFTLKEFRDHLYQERDKQDKLARRFARKSTRMQHPNNKNPNDDRAAADAPHAAKFDEDLSDLSSLKVSELKEMLRTRGLKMSGRKAELIERLNSSN